MPDARKLPPAWWRFRPRSLPEAGELRYSISWTEASAIGRAIMAEQPTAPQQVNLQELARKLREAEHLGPEAQQAVADLVDELAKALPPAGAGQPEATHLAESAAHLAGALHERHEHGVLTAAVARLEAAVARAESKVPL